VEGIFAVIFFASLFNPHTMPPTSRASAQMPMMTNWNIAFLSCSLVV
jgi:hypothetical protein